MQINATGLIQIFLTRYKIWKDCQQFYTHSVGPVAEMSPSGIPCFHYKDYKNINACSSKLIAIDCLTESIHSLRFFQKYNKENHYLIFSAGWWDTEKYMLGISYSLIWSSYQLFDMADTYNTPMKFCYYVEKDYDFDSPKPLVFVSTVGNTRPERDFLVNQLEQQLLYKNFILRYSGQDYGVASADLDVVTFKLGEFDPYTVILKSYFHSVSQTLPINMYNQVRFNLVVETDIDFQDSFLPSEKIFKALITGIPFVVVSTPFFLKHLRNLGFETYSKFWDESYDLEIDYQKRIEKIIALCNQLHNFDWEAHRAELEFIKFKNRSNFLNLNRAATSEFLNFERVITGLES
jgi:hypothetical protein